MQIDEKQIEERIIEEMSHISSELAHDLRSPLQTIQNAIYLIQRNPENDQLYTMVRQSLQQATAILDNFREYYKGHILRPLEVDPVKVIDLSFSDVTIPENITVTKDIPETTPVNVDPSKLALALRKLIQNAVEALPEGGEIKVSLRDDGEAITVTISDNGPGISSDLIEFIDKPFFSEHKKGKGLGIPIAKRIIESHGGEMTLETSPDKGTRWRIRVPRSAVNL